MSIFRLVGGTNGYDSASQAHAPLTPLPAKLFDKSKATTIPKQGDPVGDDFGDKESRVSLFPKPSTRFEGQAELGGATFAELLGRGDLREAVVMCPEVAHHGTAMQTSREVQTPREDVTTLVLPGGDWGIVGPDANLLLSELHRLQISQAQKRRRRLGYFAGGVTLIILGSSLWMFSETIVNVIRFGGVARGALRWVQFTLLIIIVSLLIVVTIFLRTRRPSTLVAFALVSSSVVTLLHISLATINFVLTFVWKEELVISKYSWRIDVAWIDLDGSQTEGTAKQRFKVWTIVALVRLFVVITVTLVWVKSVRLYNNYLRTPFIISPAALPSSEVQALLSLHRASIVRLSPSDHRNSNGRDHSPDWLPSHTDRAHYVEASAASAVYSLVSQRTRSSTRALDHREFRGEGENSGVTTWLQAKVWQGIGWLFAVAPYQGRDDSSDNGDQVADVEDFGKEAPYSPSADGKPLNEPPLSISDHLSSDILSSGSECQHSSMPNPESTLSMDVESLENSKRFSNDSTESLLRTSEDVADLRGVDVIPPPVPPEDGPDFGTGSSGSSGGQIVYVRMSDGNLVRRLSTIASLDMSGSEVA